MLDGCVPWPEEFARRYSAQGLWSDATLFDALQSSARAQPDALAVVDASRRCSYGELLQRAESLAAGLYAIGLRPLDRVVFQLGNGVGLVEAFFALARLGAIPVLALPAHRQTEICHIVQASAAVAWMIPDRVRDFDYRAMAHDVAAQCPSLRQVLVDGPPAAGQVDMRVLGEGLEAPACAQPDAGEVALMLLSGGTTGLPKLIPRTHRDYLCGVRHSAQAARFDRQTVYLAVLPMAHNYTLGAPGVLGALALGGRVVIAPGTAAEQVLPLIERERVTVVSAAVPLVSRWLGSEWLGRCDLRSLQVFMCGGARLAPELRRRVEHGFGCLYQESYGTAEGLLNMTRLDDDEALRLNSSGRPVCDADEICIVDPDGHELPDGQAGELQARGPYTIRGYYAAPEADQRAFTPDGFYRMGDVARRVDGYLYLEGRLKELINRGGEKISCEDIENHILAHPLVEAACVVAVPDPVFGEKACAVLILRPGAALDLERLLEFLRGRGIARFKWPEQLEVVDEFPISPAGKVRRRDLQAALALQSARAG